MSKLSQIKRKIDYFKNLSREESGQIGIVLLLITVVLVTISLSIVTRSVTDVSLSKREEDSQRAFSAAEAGIEDALRQDLSSIVGSHTIPVTSGGVSGSYDVALENTLVTQIDASLKSLEVNLDGLSSGDSVVVDWSFDGDCTVTPAPAALIISIYNSASETIVRREAYDGCPIRRGINGFIAPSAGVGAYNFQVTETLGSNNEDLMIIKTVYNDTDIRVSGGGTALPSQFYTIHSEAVASGGESRAILVTETFPAPPSIFDFAIFSGLGNL